jgi:hypothetical protein
MDDADIPDGDYPPLPLRVGDWLWRPWYAKLYWAAAISYWTFVLVSWLWGLAPGYFNSVAGGYTSLVFHPFMILPVLGFGYGRAWAARAECHAPGPEDPVLRRRSIGGPLDPHADTADPRSGINWVGSPQSRDRRFS